MQAPFRAIRLAQPDASLRFWLIGILVFQSGGQRGIHHLAQRCHVVVAHPLPQAKLFLKYNRLIIKYFDDVFRVEIGFFVMNFDNDCRVAFRAVERHHHTHALPHLRRHFIADSVGKKPFEGQRKYYIDVSHRAYSLNSAKLRKKYQFRPDFPQIIQTFSAAPPLFESKRGRNLRD